MLHTLNVYNVIHELYLNFEKETLKDRNRDNYTLSFLIIMTFMSFFFFLPYCNICNLQNNVE